MALSERPLSYCTNVHPGRTLAEVEQKLDEYTAPMQREFGHPLAAGLWLARPVVQELLASPERLPRFAEGLRQRELSCYTLNAFPYGDFHSARVKENVYIPDWSQPERLQYTLDCARVLGNLLDGATEGSLSTVPLGFKEFDHDDDFLDRCIGQLVDLATGLDRLYQETGKLIRLAIEPEPFCILETTPETLEFFDRLRDRAADQKALKVVQTHLGVCYDVCHQAVEFEDVTASIAALQQSDVRINKVHITCAIRLKQPAERADSREALAGYVEPRYLHQTMARSASGEILRAVDLTEELARTPHAEFLEADEWRVHFHVPVNAETLGPLETTRTELKQALSAAAKLDYEPHLEVETYTWEVLPGGRKTGLVEGLTRELSATQQLLGELRASVAPST